MCIYLLEARLNVLRRGLETICAAISRRLRVHWTEMTTYLLDGNIFDEILLNRSVRNKLRELCENDQIALIGTWIESRELKAMSPSKPEKWLEIKELLSELRIIRVPVAGMILDHSRLGETRLISWDQSAILQKSLKESGDNENDMALAMTAKFEGATLVTEDTDMQKKAKEIIGVQVLSWPDFASECLATKVEF